MVEPKPHGSERLSVSAAKGNEAPPCVGSATAWPPRLHWDPHLQSTRPSAVQFGEHEDEPDAEDAQRNHPSR
jgi:hypothetical protein